MANTRHCCRYSRKAPKAEVALVSLRTGKMKFALAILCLLVVPVSRIISDIEDKEFGMFLG